MKTKEKLIIRIIIISVVVFSIITQPIPYRVKFDKSIAEELLKETYMPLEDFVKAGIPVEDEELLLVPNDIRNKEDFMRLFNNKINTRIVEDFYKSLVIEKPEGLYIDKKVYIPNIYAESSILTNSYIKKWRRSLYSYISGEDDSKEEKLIIKEKWKISGEWHRRNNYFVKNENGEWVLDHFGGISKYGFTDPSHNPWNYY